MSSSTAVDRDQQDPKPTIQDARDCFELKFQEAGIPA